MGKFGKELIESLTEAAAHAKGRRVKRVRVAKVKTSKVKAIRRSSRRR
jgi:putative transcriptional regulator